MLSGLTLRVIGRIPAGYSIQRAFDGQAAALEDVGVDHGGADVLVAEQFLDGANIVAILEQMGGKGMAKGMATDALLDARFLGGFLDGALKSRFVHVVAAFFAAARVGGAFGGRKEVLPNQFAIGFGVFLLERAGQVNFAKARGQVFLVVEADLFDLPPEGGDDGIGQGRDAVFFPLSIADGDGFVFKVNILDAQSDTFHKAKAGAVEDLGHEFKEAVHLSNDAHGFIAAEDGGKTFGAFSGGKQNRFDFLVEHFAVQEEDGAEGLVLGGGGDVPFGGEVDDIGTDLVGAHLGGMLFMVEEDVAADPIEVGFFGAVGVMLKAEGVLHLFEKFFCHGNSLTVAERSV